MTRITDRIISAARPGEEISWLEWRARLLASALWCALVFGGIAFWGSLLISGVNLAVNTLIAVVVCYVWILAAAVVVRLPYHLRSASLLLALFAAGSFLIYHSILPVVGISFILAFLVLSTLLLDWREAIISATLALAGLSVVLLLSPANQEFSAPVSFYPISLLSLLAITAALIPLALYRYGSVEVLQTGKELFTAAEQQKSQYQASINQITREFDTHLVYEKSLNETIDLLFSARSTDQLLTGTLKIIADLYSYQRAEIYYLAERTTFTRTVHFIDDDGTTRQESNILDYDIAPRLVQQFVQAEQPQQIMVDWRGASEDIEAGSVATAWMPITTGSQTSGVLTVSKMQGKAFSEIEVNALKTNLQLLAMGLMNLQLSMTGQIQPGNISAANQAIQLLNQAETTEQILRVVQNAFRISTFPSVMLSAIRDGFQLMAVNDPPHFADMDKNLPHYPRELFEKPAAGSPFTPFQLSDSAHLPEELKNILIESGWICAAMIPIYQNERLNTLYILGSRQPSGLTPFSIQPYANLAGYAASTLEKIIATRHLQRRVAALQSLAAISQTISVVTDLEDLFDTVHEQITQVIGEVDLAIALYDPGTDMITIPYAHESGEKISLEQFPLGQGLTSILIRSRQPLMLVEDTEKKALELGAKVVGASAKSWLGVPLIVSGEILGAIILQDTDHEQRFDEDDLRLMTTLASQLAITIRNIRLLKEAEHKAEKERIISSITTKIWAAPDVESVTRTALLELGRALNASSGTIRLDMPTKDRQAGNPIGTETVDRYQH